MTGFGKLLRLLREMHGETLDELATVTGSTRQWINRLESTDVTNPRFDLVFALADHYGMSTDDVMRASIFAETEQGYVMLRKAIRKASGAAISEFVRTFDAPLDDVLETQPIKGEM